MSGLLNFTLLDHSGEKSNMSVRTGDVTAVSLPGLLTETGALRNAIDGITLGTLQSEQLTAFNTVLSNTLPSNVNAQRERKWLVVYQDDTQFFDPPVNAIPNEGYLRKYTLEIPTADPSGRMIAGTDLADPANAEIQAFVTAFENTGRSPAGGRVKVLSISLVGRNL